jgi:hypothetical protein
MEPTELQRLLVKEVSGVDDPANEIPGWMVAKAAAAAGEDTPTFVARLKASLGRPAGKDDIDMTADELTATLTANNEALAKSIVDGVGAAVADAVTKAAPAPEAQHRRAAPQGPPLSPPTALADFGGAGQAPLSVEQVTQFIELMQAEQVMLADVRTVTSGAAKWQESIINFASRIAKAGTEGTRLAAGSTASLRTRASWRSAPCCSAARCRSRTRSSRTTSPVSTDRSRWSARSRIASASTSRT